MRCASKNKALIMILYWWADFCTTCVWETKNKFSPGQNFGEDEGGGGGIFGGGRYLFPMACQVMHVH